MGLLRLKGYLIICDYNDQLFNLQGKVFHPVKNVLLNLTYSHATAWAGIHTESQSQGQK